MNSINKKEVLYRLQNLRESPVRSKEERVRRIYENLLTGINHYETIAERVAKLEGKSFDVKDNTDPQMTENGLICNLFLDKISPYRIFSKGKYIVQKIQQILSRTNQVV